MIKLYIFHYTSKANYSKLFKTINRTGDNLSLVVPGKTQGYASGVEFPRAQSHEYRGVLRPSNQYGHVPERTA